jgi:mannose/cellobiose epimerase-like protein (N-acyl-D-glucosamine 2-epimerase family)
MGKKITEINEIFTSITIEVLDAIIARSEQDPHYPFIDTKLNIITGKNIYPPAPGQDYNAKNIIFSWIQGRGMEALAGHAQWLEENIPKNQERITKIRAILEKLTAKMEECRAKNNGRMFFIMNENGNFLQVGPGGQLIPAENIRATANFSDLFYSKGLLAAAAYLGQKNLIAKAEKYFEEVVNDIRAGHFVSDQQSFDPKNKVAFVEGKLLQGPCMICLDGIALAAQICDRPKWLRTAREMIEYIFETHINTGQFADFEKYDFWEAVDASGLPWEENGQVLCDPGHALEFVGLSLKCILQMRCDSSHETVAFVDKYRQHLPQLFKHCYKLGFASNAGGIIKAFDLRHRVPINTDMPWWSLPETIRAAAEIFEFTEDAAALDILNRCANTFFDNYLNPAVHSMAYQTRNAAGKVVEVIPATPDADPGYHTGLSLIDAIKIIENKF